MDRRVRLWSQILAYGNGRPVGVGDVCAAALATVGVDRAAVTVLLDATPRETVYASDQVTVDLQELTLTLGEGPGLAPPATGPVLVSDLATPESLVRWPVFAPAAVRAGVRAMFVLPLLVGAARLGVLDLYRGTPGGLRPEQLADALALAEMTATLLLDGADPAAPGAPRRWPERTAAQHPEVHQAIGMLTVQLGVSAAVALIRLRAYAYAHDRRLRDVAGDVVARRLRFAAESGTGTDGAAR